MSVTFKWCLELVFFFFFVSISDEGTLRMWLGGLTKYWTGAKREEEIETLFFLLD